MVFGGGYTTADFGVLVALAMDFFAAVDCICTAYVRGTFLRNGYY